MTVIDYRRHFAYLALAAGALFLAHAAFRKLALGFAAFAPVFALNGLLHASALVLALNSFAPIFKRVGFIGITAAISAAVPYSGLYLAQILGLDGFFAAISLGSAVGATAYWLLVRAFWLRDLSRNSLALTAAICVAASLASFVGAGAVTGFGKSPFWIADALPTIGWWLAFSFSLYLAEGGAMTANQRLERP
jgi:hypothetical protein